MLFSWILTVLISIFLGVAITLFVQYYLFLKHFVQQKIVTVEKKLKPEPFQLPKVLLDVIHCNQLVTKESCIALNLLLQFIFHELRDTEKIRLWFKRKLCLEFEELLSRSAIGKMVDNIRILDFDLGSEFPVINSISIDDVKVNKDYSHIDLLDLNLDFNYTGDFRLVVEANMVLGKAAHISVKVNELYGEGKLQFTRIPYSHWSFSFCNEPKLQLQVESHLQGRPFHQITNFITNQIRKSLRKKHTLPNYKIRYKPFFSAAESTSHSATCIPPGQLQMVIHKVSRLNEIAPENCEIYCIAGLDYMPWVEIVHYRKSAYYVLDIVVTKKMHQTTNFVFRQEHVEEKNQVCVILEEIKYNISNNQDSLCRDDIILTIDGKKVSAISQAQKLIKSAAFQFTVRVERKVRMKICEESSKDTLDPTSSAAFCGLRKRKSIDSENSSSNVTPVSGSPGNRVAANQTSEAGKFPNSQRPKDTEDNVDDTVKLLKSKCRPNRQIILFEEDFTFPVKEDERYLNVNIRFKNIESSKDMLLGYINIPLIEIQNSNDTLKCLKLKPPDNFIASNIRTHDLLSHSGFIPLLCYGDILLTLQFYPSAKPAFTSLPEIVEPTLTPELDVSPAFPLGDKKHNFINTHFQTSTQCDFCGKKIWWKDAGKCQDCYMTCHKKCIVKCQAETICIMRPETVNGALGTDEDVLRVTLDAEAAASSRESTPQPTPKKRLGNLLATVASAGRGLKRVGSANNLALPGDSLQNSQSRSLPPSPQQSPGPSRKPSLPVDNESIAFLLRTLMEHRYEQGEIMDFAKESGKTLFAELDTVERRRKIKALVDDVKLAIDEETYLRQELVKKEQLEKDPTCKAKTAFLIGKIDEKLESLTILMLHLCSALQHIQDLEDQEGENEVLVINTSASDKK